MRRTMLGIVLSTAVVVVPFTAFAQSMNLWVGTWKLNFAKSTFDPGPPLVTSNTATFDLVNGVARLTADAVNAQGQKDHTVVLVTFDGKEQPLVGANPPVTRTHKWIDERTWEWVDKVNARWWARTGWSSRAMARQQR